MRTELERATVKIDMELLTKLIKREGLTVGEFAELLGYTRRTWYMWKSQGGVSATAFIKIGILFDWFDIPEEFGFEFVTNRQ